MMMNKMTRTVQIICSLWISALLLAGCTPQTAGEQTEAAVSVTSQDQTRTPPTQQEEEIYWALAERLEIHRDPALDPEYGAKTTEERKALTDAYEENTFGAVMNEYNLSQPEVMAAWSKVKNYYVAMEMPLQKSKPQADPGGKTEITEDSDLNQVIKGLVEEFGAGKVELSEVLITSDGQSPDSSKAQVELLFMDPREIKEANDGMKTISTKVVKALQDAGISKLSEIGFIWTDEPNGRIAKYQYIYSETEAAFELGEMED